GNDEHPSVRAGSVSDGPAATVAHASGSASQANRRFVLHGSGVVLRSGPVGLHGGRFGLHPRPFVLRAAGSRPPHATQRKFRPARTLTPPPTPAGTAP